MKILLINKYHYVKGGSDRVYFNTGSLLQSNGHDVAYFSTEHPDNLDCLYSVSFVSYRDNRKSGFIQKIKNSAAYLYNKEASAKLGELIDKFHPDIAHLNLFYGDLSASILLKLREKRIPVVHTVHDYKLICPANSLLDADSAICEKCINRAYYQCTIKKCMEGNLSYSIMLTAEAYGRKYLIDPLNYIDRFIFVSKFAESKHIEFDKRFAAKADHLYNFTFLTQMTKQDKREKYLLYYGRLVREKGILTLLEACKTLRVQLKIAGTGPLEKVVSQVSSQYSNIQYLGYTSGEELTRLIQDSYFVVVPSEWYENNPMTVIEAYAEGVPVIAARIGGIPEIVLDSKTGFLFQTGDDEDLKKTVIKAMALSLEDYNSLSLEAMKFAVTQFSPEQHYKGLMNIYQGVI